MNEDKMRQIAKEVFDAQLSKTQYDVSSVPYHLHNGTDSPQLSQANVNPYFRANGLIVMATDGAVYTLGLNFKGSRVDFNGVATHGSPIDKRALVNGIAMLGASYQFRAQSGTSVVVGGDVQNIIQGSSSLTIDSSGGSPTFAAISSGEHIVYVVQPGTGAQVAVATVSDYGQGFVKVRVALATGWSITGTFTVS